MTKKEWSSRPRWKTVRPGDMVVRWQESSFATGSMLGLVVSVEERPASQSYYALVVWGQGASKVFSEWPTTSLMKVSLGE